MNKNKYIAFGFLIYSATLTAFAEAPWGSISNEAIDQCRHINSNMDRLLCFDKLFKANINTNITVEKPEVAQNNTVQLSPFISYIQDIENKRNISPNLFLSHIQYEGRSIPKGESYDKQLYNKLGEVGYNVYLTKPAIDASQSFKPILSLSCINDITSLQIILPKAYGNIHSAEIDLSYAKDRGEKQRWRVLMNGQVLSAPRGLESISYIQKLQREKLLQIQTSLNNQPITAVFDLSDLRAELAPLARACNWSR